MLPGFAWPTGRLQATPVGKYTCQNTFGNILCGGDMAGAGWYTDAEKMHYCIYR